jgi:(1->4)-alpha-D-glucan 1-alpha-D-glucosylmutase
MNHPSPLRATYRLQLHRDFPFAAAAALAPYLQSLGISHVYASPIFAAVPGSSHGYDVVDPNRLNPDLGGEEGFAKLCAALDENGLGLILDIVPNHMAVSPHNPYWMETLEFGRTAPAAVLFDIDWEAPANAGKILLPVLGDPLLTILESGGLCLQTDVEAGRLTARYAEHVFPLSPATTLELVGAAASRHPELADVAETWAPLAAGDRAAETIARARTSLRGVAPAALAETLAEADLPAILDEQHWRLAWWRTGADDLNYRRFFNVTQLVGVCVEHPEVFAITHRLVLELVRQGKIAGLRIDHIDGLLDPAAYLARLRAAVGTDVPLFVEKILEYGEKMPAWPVDGTTGYERLNDLDGLFLDEDGYRAFEADLRAHNLLLGSPAQRLARAKRDILAKSLVTEVDTLVALARDGLDAEIRARDLTETAIRRGVIALIVHCPVYRTYATEHAHSESDEEVWQAIREAVGQEEDPLTEAAAGLLLDRLAAPETASDRQFRLRLQQVSGPAMAKGFEDTELYRNMTLLSANEVGGSIEHPWRSVEEMHARLQAREGAIDLTPRAPRSALVGACSLAFFRSTGR